MRVTVIGGGGTIGSTAAYTLALARPDLDIALCDVDADAAWGHATDLRHARCHAAHPVGETSSPTGPIETVAPGPAAVRDADCLLITASVPRPEGGAERGGRETFWPANREVADTIATWLSETAPCPTVVVTNPVDRMVWRLYEQSGWPRERFLGYSLSETARVADELARRLDADPAAVDCPVLGEHGEHLVIAFSRATVDGTPVTLDADTREAVLEYARTIPYDVIQRRGSRDSSRWVTGRGAALLVDTLLAGGTTTPVCLSTPPAGAYGIDGVSIGVPVRLSSHGVDQVVEWPLHRRERTALMDAARAIRQTT